MQTLDVLADDSLAPVAGRIEADALILAGAEDHFIPANQAGGFAGALTAARSVRTIVRPCVRWGRTLPDGAQALWHADLFDWIPKPGEFR